MRRNRFSPWGLTPQLFLFVVLPLTVLLILVTFGGLALHQRAMRDLVGERDERTVRAAAAALGAQLEHRLSVLQTLGLSISGTDPAVLNDLLARSDFLQSYFPQGLALMSPDGELLASLGDAEQWQAWGAALNRDLLPASGDAARLLSAASPQPGNSDGVVLLAASPVPGSTVVLLGAFSPGPVIADTLTAAILRMGDHQVFVVDGQGRLLYQSGGAKEEFPTNRHVGVEQALQGKSGATYLPADEGEHVVAYGPVPGVGWALVSEEPWAMVTNPLLDLTENAPLVLIPAVLLAILALWFATHRIVQPLQALEARAARLAWSDFTALDEPVGGIQEIRSLQETLNFMARRLLDAQRGLRDYIGAITRGQEDERLRLARELHDDTLQALIALKQRFQLVSLASEGGAQDEGLAEIEALADQTIQNLRRVTRGLRPAYLEDLGLGTALEMLAREAGSGSPTEIDFRRSGTERRLGSTVELALYRIAQEALTNVVHHAGAQHAALKIDYGENGVRLQVNDDGSGFEIPESPAGFSSLGHFGLLGMYERAEMIGAQLTIRSQPGTGTAITVDLPMHPDSGEVEKTF